MVLYILLSMTILSISHVYINLVHRPMEWPHNQFREMHPFNKFKSFVALSSYRNCSLLPVIPKGNS
jgi:hypothetical protein